MSRRRWLIASIAVVAVTAAVAVAGLQLLRVRCLLPVTPQVQPLGTAPTGRSSNRKLCAPASAETAAAATPMTPDFMNSLRCS